MMNKAEKILAILEKHNVELPQAVLDELNAAGFLGPGGSPPQSNGPIEPGVTRSTIWPPPD